MTKNAIFSSTDEVPELDIVWEKQVDDTLPFKGIMPQFGLFLRDEDGHMKGGLWGSFNDKASVQHMYIHAFYTDPTVRGAGFGKRLMMFAEDYTRTAGFSHILLGTGDHQSPWFYDKMGFTRVAAMVHFAKNTRGQFIHNYVYRKDLNTYF